MYYFGPQPVSAEPKFTLMRDSCVFGLTVPPSGECENMQACNFNVTLLLRVVKFEGRSVRKKYQCKLRKKMYKTLSL